MGVEDVAVFAPHLLLKSRFQPFQLIAGAPDRLYETPHLVVDEVFTDADFHHHAVVAVQFERASPDYAG